MTSLDPNFGDLLTCLNSAGARYLLVGGYAVNYHGHHRNTKDLDLWIAVDAGNADRVASALRAFGFSARTVRGSMFRNKGTSYTFGPEPFRVDILTQPDGVEFDACYGRRVEARIDGIHVPVIALTDLLTNKAASGRPQDLGDVETLCRHKPPAPSSRRKKK